MSEDMEKNLDCYGWGILRFHCMAFWVSFLLSKYIVENLKNEKKKKKKKKPVHLKSKLMRRIKEMERKNKKKKKKKKKA